MVLLCLDAACTRAPLLKPEEALRAVDPGDVPDLRDDLPLDPFLAAVKDEIAFLNSEKGRTITEFRFGAQVYSREDYLEGLEHLRELAQDAPSKEHFLQRVKRDFDFYEVYGNGSWGHVLVTGYYEPEVKGSPRRTARYTHPLLGMPEDLVEVQISSFGDKFKDLGPVIRGRLEPQRNDAGYHTVVPYYTRSEIEDGSLGGRRLEIAWVDPIDGFFLEVQGSGTVDLPTGRKLRVGYAAQNGQTYESIGRFLTDVIPKEQMSLQTIEAYLRGLPAPDSRRILDKNPSYVFFKRLDGPAVTYLGTPAVGGRTIATDARFFPKGALAYLTFDSPTFAAPDAAQPMGTEAVGRLVIDSDRGGAIKGGGRVDLFWGAGPDARQHAGVLKSDGRLLYLAPKAVVLAQRRLKKEAELHR
jgi:membrane-bound lytic murein transglycosylase A